MSSILFQCKLSSNFPMKSRTAFDKAISVYTDGRVVKELYKAGTKDITASEDLPKNLEFVIEVNEILEKYKNFIDKIPEELNNGSADGDWCIFQFGEKFIEGPNISSSNLKEILESNPRYYREYIDNMVLENLVIKISKEILRVLRCYAPGLRLPLSR